MTEVVERHADDELDPRKNHTEVPNELFGLSLSANAKLVYIVLLKFCTWGTFDDSFPTMRTIVEYAGMSENTARKAIAELDEHSLCEVLPRYRKDGSRTSNAYQLHHPKHACARLRPPPQTPEGGGSTPEALGAELEQGLQTLEEGGSIPEALGAEVEEQDLDTLTEIPGQEEPFPARTAQEQPTMPPHEAEQGGRPPANREFAAALAQAQERDRKRREARAMMHPTEEEREDEEHTGWEWPDTPDQRELLEACGAKRFDQKQKRLVGMISGLMATAAILGDQAWTGLESYLSRTTGALDPGGLPYLPRLWWDERLEQARKYRWSRKGLLKALLDRERLTEFVRRQVRQQQKGGLQTYDTGQQATGSTEGYTIFSPASLVARRGHTAHDTRGTGPSGSRDSGAHGAEQPPHPTDRVHMPQVQGPGAPARSAEPHPA